MFITGLIKFFIGFIGVSGTIPIVLVTAFPYRPRLSDSGNEDVRERQLHCRY